MFELETTTLIGPAFLAGLLTFLAPCTFPLVPAYLAFISGISPEDLADEAKRKQVHKRIIVNGLFYVIGFSSVFISLGMAFSFGGSVITENRQLIARLGGALIVLFGLYLIAGDKLSWLKFMNADKRFHPGRLLLHPGKPGSSFLFGATFAFGWTPCVGPILGSILLLASTSGHILGGALLLFIFSLGLAIPFLLIAFGASSATKYIARVNHYLPIISKIGGALLLLLGVIMLAGEFGHLIAWTDQLFDFIPYEAFINYL